MHIAICFHKIKNPLTGVLVAIKSPVFLLLLSLIPISALTALAANQTPGQLAVPATFIRNIKIPGKSDQILRPSSLHFDKNNQEILVCDSGHNRVVIFSVAGAYKFEFPVNNIMSSPKDLITDSEGYIFVVGIDSDGTQIGKFDYDGTFIMSLSPPKNKLGDIAVLSSIAINLDDYLYCLDANEKTIHVFDDNSLLIKSFPAETGENLNPDNETILGTLSLIDNELLIPVSSSGYVARLDTSGNYLGSIGFFGSKPGALNFPVAVEKSFNNKFMILDSARFCVVCYNQNGKAVGEFGGKGLSPGWFINPTLISVLSEDRIAIGQIYNSKIQVCSIPSFISLGNNTYNNSLATNSAELATVVIEGNVRRSISKLFNNLDSNKENFVSYLSEPISHLEVF